MNRSARTCCRRHSPACASAGRKPGSRSASPAMPTSASMSCATGSIWDCCWNARIGAEKAIDLHETSGRRAIGSSSRIVVKDMRLALFASASHPLRGHSFARSSMAPYPLFVSAAALEFRDFMHRYTGKHRSQCMTSSNDPRATTTMSGRYGCLSLERARRNSARALEQSSF